MKSVPQSFLRLLACGLHIMHCENSIYKDEFVKRGILVNSLCGVVPIPESGPGDTIHNQKVFFPTTGSTKVLVESGPHTKVHQRIFHCIFPLSITVSTHINDNQYVTSSFIDEILDKLTRFDSLNAS
jgi:hypothetical protein